MLKKMIITASVVASIKPTSLSLLRRRSAAAHVGRFDITGGSAFDVVRLVQALAVALLLIHTAQAQERSSSRFHINGRNVELTQSLLAQFRQSWLSGTEVTTVLSKSDAQWVLDLIAITEAAVRRPACRALSFDGKEVLEKTDHEFNGRTVSSGRFDELWLVSACGQRKRFRVVNPKGTSELVVYEVEDPGFGRRHVE